MRISDWSSTCALPISKHRDTADPGQGVLVEALVVPALGLLQNRCLVVRYGYVALDPVQLLQKMLFRHCLRGGVAMRLAARGAGRDKQSKCQNDGSKNRPDRARAPQALRPQDRQRVGEGK